MCARRKPLQRWVSAIPADLVRGVKSLAVSHSTTIFSTLLAAFQLTLSKWTGKDDILVGTPVANRNKEAVRETMGYFAGVVPLRGQVDRTQNFSDHLRAVSESALDSFANAMPFAELAAAVAASSRRGRAHDFRRAFRPAEPPGAGRRAAADFHQAADALHRHRALRPGLRADGSRQRVRGCLVVQAA